MASFTWGLGIAATVASGRENGTDPRHLLRFALAEVAGVIGLVVYLLSGAHLVQLACAGCGLLAHLLAFPSTRAVEAHAVTRR